MFLDPLYLVMVLPAFLLSLYATLKVKTTYAKYSKIPTTRGVTGAQAARQILLAAGISDVEINRDPGFNGINSCLRLDGSPDFGFW